MRKFLPIVLCILCLITSCKDKETEQKLSAIESAIKQTNPAFRIYPTSNMWNFLKLDTRNGKITIVQYSVEDNSKTFEYTLSNEAIVNENKPGRFILQPTQNIYNFIMLDQVSGATYQVQWSFEEDKRFVLPIQPSM